MGSLSTAKPGRKAGAAPGTSRPNRKPAARPKAAAKPPAPVPADVEVPPFPHGWTARQWAALCNSQANRDAHRLHAQAEALGASIRAFLDAYGPNTDADALAAAGVPLPVRNLEHLTWVRNKLPGLGWCLENFTDPVADVLPDAPDDAAASPAEERTAAAVHPIDRADTAADPSALVAMDTVHIAYIHNTQNPGIRPRLLVTDEAAQPKDEHLFGEYESVTPVGTVEVPRDALAVEIERAVADRFGTYEGEKGRPVRVEYASPGWWDAIVGRVAALLMTWDRHVGPGERLLGPWDKVHKVAALLTLTPLDALDVMAKLGAVHPAVADRFRVRMSGKAVAA